MIMKRLFKALAAMMLCGAMVAPMAEAQGRGNRNGGRPSTSSSSSRPSSASRPSSGGSSSRPSSVGGQRPSSRPSSSQSGFTRPSNSGQRPTATPPSRPNNNFNDNNATTRPGHNDNNTATRPGHNPGTRPGHNDNNAPGRPDYGSGGTRPGNGFGPGRPGSGNHAVRPGGSPAHRPHPGVRPRPNTPPPAYRPVPPRPWVRPVPPPRWVPGPRVPTFTTLLGLSFGYGFNASINFLLSNNYTVHSYGNNTVYLNDVDMLNMMWPDATLYYSNGGLQYGDFIYATDYYDTARYNMTYSRMVNAYGNPVSTSYPDNGMRTCWYGRDGRFVTLTYAPMRGADGYLRYYTTLSFGM